MPTEVGEIRKRKAYMTSNGDTCSNSNPRYPANHFDDAGSPAVTRRAFPIDEFCRLYGIGRTTAYYEIATGRLRAVKVGRRTLVPHDAAEAWLAALPEAGRSHHRDRQEKHHGG
jgi:excisionase family DNA binding protein